MAATVRIGVVGCGSVAQVIHLPLLRRERDAHVVAIADPSATARAAAIRSAPGARVYDDYAALVSSPDVDAVLVCTPSASHGAIGLQVLEAGKHLYLEKPLAIDHEGAERAVAAAEETNRVAAIGFNRRFHPVVRRLRAAVQRLPPGSLHELRTEFIEPIAGSLPEWKRRRATGGGALLDLASHHVDLVRQVTGEEVELESASIRSIASEGDDADLVVRLASGARAVIGVSFHGARTDLVEVRSDSGTFRADRHAGLRSRLHPGWDPSYRTALRAFVARVQGSEVVLPTLMDGLRSLEVILAAELAAA